MAGEPRWPEHVGVPPPRVERPERLLLIAATSHGNLANRLLHFSHLLALAHERGYGLINPSFGEYAEFFEGTANSLFCRYPLDDAFLDSDAVRALVQLWCRADTEKSIRTARDLDRLTTPEWRGRLAVFTTSMAKAVAAQGLPPSSALRTISLSLGEKLQLEAIDLAAGADPLQLLFLDGWGFKAFRPYRRQEALFRQFFRPIASYRQRIDAIRAAARGDGDVLIGIHVRHGDYRSWSGGRYYFAINVYVRIMRELRARLPHHKVRFLLCSNEEQPRDAFRDLHVVFGSGHFVEDLYALAGCDIVIGPLSTYSYWASLQGNTALEWLQDPRWSPSDEWIAQLAQRAGSGRNDASVERLVVRSTVARATHH